MVTFNCLLPGGQRNISGTVSFHTHANIHGLKVIGKGMEGGGEQTRREGQIKIKDAFSYNSNALGFTHALYPNKVCVQLKKKQHF